MRMDRSEDFFINPFHRTEENVFVNELCRICSHVMSTEKLSMLAHEDFDETVIFVRSNRFPICGERSFPHFVLDAFFFQSALSETH